MTSLHMYSHIGKMFDREGNLIPDKKTYGDRVVDESYWRVAADQRNGIFISTRWIGTDLAKGISPHPFIFETVMFEVGDPADTFYAEYSPSEELAMLAHRRAVRYAEQSRRTDT